MNAIIGDNGIITKAQDATFLSQKAILQEYIDQFYMEHYEDFENESNKALTLSKLDESRQWIYKGKLGYIVDNDGYVHYFLLINNMPKEIRETIKYGNGEKSYSDYVNCIDVWGVTEDLKVYYCSNGNNSINGIELSALSKENGNDIVFDSGDKYAKLISGNSEDKITKNDIKSVNNITLDSSLNISNLNELYKFTSLQDLTLKNLTLGNLDGIEYLTKVKRIYFTNCTIENYSKLAEISSKIQYLFFEDTNNSEIEKFCSNTQGIGGVDFPNLAYLGIYGEKHYSIDYQYDQIYTGKNESVKHGEFSELRHLSNLSDVTKKRITNLFLNNNSIKNIDNLYEFSGVTRLRIEGNYLEDLNGIYNKSKNIGMISLRYLYANSNCLGKNESATEMNTETDSLSIFANSTYDEVNLKYVFTSRFSYLYTVSLTNNSIIWMNYLSSTNSINRLRLENISTLNLNSGIQSLMPILEKNGIEIGCDSYVQTYINDNSKKIEKLSLANKTMTASEFLTYLEGRENYVKLLNINNLILKDDSGVVLTNETELKFNNVINTALKKLNKIVALRCYNLKYLTTIDFVENLNSLNQIDLRGTNVVDLDKLVTYCPAIASVIIDNPNIKLFNEEDDNGIRPISAFESLCNKIKNNGINTSYAFYMESKGVILTSLSLIDDLKFCTNLTYFRSSFYNLGCIFKESNVTFDLRNSKITDLSLMWCGSSKGDKFLLPTTIKNVSLVNCDYVSGYRFDATNLASCNSLTNISGNNCDWNVFWQFASKLPAVTNIDFYKATITSNNSLESYIDDLKKAPLEKLYIYGHPPYSYMSTVR